MSVMSLAARERLHLITLFFCYKASPGFSQRHPAKVLRFLSFLVLGLLNENLC